MLNKNGLTSQKFINLQIHFTILEHILNFFIHQKIFSCNFFSAFLAPYPTIVIKAKSIPERKFHNLLQQLKTSLLSPILILSFTNPNFYYIFQRIKPSFHWFWCFVSILIIKLNLLLLCVFFFGMNAKEQQFASG